MARIVIERFRQTVATYQADKHERVNRGSLVNSTIFRAGTCT